MKRILILPCCLILAGLVVAVLVCIHCFSTISEQEAARIATEYVKSENGSTSSGDIKINQIVLTSDLVTLVTGSQQWIAWSIGPKDVWTWLYIDAYTGKIKNKDYGWKEWVVPTDIPQAGQIVSFLPVIPYAFMILFSFLYSKKGLYKIRLWVSAVLFALSFPAYILVVAIIRFFFPV